MIERPTKEFLDTLGQYVYMYDDGLEILYVGKGLGDRCLFHLKDKGFNYEHCYIVARNLESFNDKPSLLLESYLINKHNPTNNAVAGHYKECFNMVSLASLYSEFKSTQHDNFEVLPSWYNDDYHLLKGNLREVSIAKDKITLISTANSGVYVHIIVSSSDDSTKMLFQMSDYFDSAKIADTRKKLFHWLEACGKTSVDIIDDKNQLKFYVNCETPNEATVLFSEFFGV